MPAPSPGIGASLWGVAAGSARSAWAVGWTDASVQTPAEIVILHWNGAVWKALPSPAPIFDFLNDVAVTPAGGAWAVGAPTDYNPSSSKTVILGWNGTAWKQAPVPASVAYNATLGGVAATSARNAWAVGWTVTGQILILRWNGTAWKRVPSASGTNSGYLDSVAARARSGRSARHPH